MNEEEKRALRQRAVELSVKLFAHQEGHSSFGVLSYADRIRIYIETGDRPR